MSVLNHIEKTIIAKYAIACRKNNFHSYIKQERKLLLIRMDKFCKENITFRYYIEMVTPSPIPF